MSFNAVILAGGESSRMGRDKAALQINGQTLLARQIQLAREAGALDVFISGRRGGDYSAHDCRVLHDEYMHGGPLAGIEKGLACCNAPLLLVLAVDLPAMTTLVLRSILKGGQDDRGAVPSVAGDLEPLAAFYPRAALAIATRLLTQKRKSVKGFAEACARSDLVRFVDLPESFVPFFVNWNSPEDL